MTDNLKNISISYIMPAIFLVWNSVTDLKKKEISQVSILLFALAGIAAFVLDQNRNLYLMVGGAALGIIVIFISVLSGESIGAGDGLVISVIGIYVGFYQTLVLLLMGFILTAVTGVLFILMKKANRKSTLPFIPFLAAAYGLALLGEFLCDIIKEI